VRQRLDKDCPPIPDFLQTLLQRLKEEDHFTKLPDQLIINEYLPGQGIHPHIDKTYCFAESVAGLSLLSPVVMSFTHPETKEKRDVLLEPRSLLVLKRESRYEWKHGIDYVQADHYKGQEIPRGNRRVSITFRVVTNLKKTTQRT